MSEILIEQSNQGRSVNVNQSDVIVIRLQENLTTGYQWEIGVIDSSVVEMLDSDYLPTSGTLIGGGGTRIFRFKAKSSGCGQIQLRLRRSWDPANSEIERFEVNIQGKDSGQEVLTNVTSEAEYHNYGKRPASEIRA
ncbi:MAG: protease inhibitor I42 family protein [Heteroscytonema crispum UTEX LB 1556]